jgi:hypothetical protein
LLIGDLGSFYLLFLTFKIFLRMFWIIHRSMFLYYFIVKWNSYLLGMGTIFPLKKKYNLSVVAHTCNPSTQKAEAGGSWVPGQPGLQSETHSQKKVQCTIEMIFPFACLVFSL